MPLPLGCSRCPASNLGMTFSGGLKARSFATAHSNWVTHPPLKALVSTLKVDPTCVSRCVAVVEVRLDEDRDLKLAIARVANNIKYHA